MVHRFRDSTLLIYGVYPRSSASLKLLKCRRLTLVTQWGVFQELCLTKAAGMQRADPPEE